MSCTSSLATISDMGCGGNVQTNSSSSRRRRTLLLPATVGSGGVDGDGEEAASCHASDITRGNMSEAVQLQQMTRHAMLSDEIILLSLVVCVSGYGLKIKTTATRANFCPD
jgi:hypothetical protein